MEIFEFFNSKNPRRYCTIDDRLNLDGVLYFVECQLGGGGESFVLKISNESDVMYAIKICKKFNKVYDNQTGKKIIPNSNFKQEIKIAKEFSRTEYKTNFITYHSDGYLTLKNSYGQEQVHSYYIMDVADETLEDYLCHRLQWEDEQEVLPQIKELANTIKLLHEKDYVHRDIKPQNILMHGTLFKLADFGMVEKENTTCEKSGPKYWPTPELLDMCDETMHCSGKQTDVFMLGCILFFIYTSKYPIGNIDIGLIHQDYKMRPIIEKMISYKIEDRYKNGEEVFKEINDIRFD